MRKWICSQCHTRTPVGQEICIKCKSPKSICDISLPLGPMERQQKLSDYRKDKNLYENMKGIANSVANIIREVDEDDPLYKKLRHGSTHSALTSIRNVHRYILDGLFKERRLDILRYTAERDPRELIRILKKISPDTLDALHARHENRSLVVKCICGVKPRVDEGIACMTKGCIVNTERVISFDVDDWNAFIKRISGD